MSKVKADIFEEDKVRDSRHNITPINHDSVISGEGVCDFWSPVKDKLL